MDKPDHFEVVAAGYAHYAPVGEVTLLDALHLASLAITYAREQGIQLLLIDSTRLTGFAPPTTAERFTVGGQFARSGQSAVKVAVIARPEMIDPERFAMIVANNRGLSAEIFTNEAEALAWLLG